MADKKPTTEEILARLRKQDSGAEGGAPSAGSAPEVTPAAEESGADAPQAAPSVPASKPKSTADILAAARGKAAVSGGAPPASTADKLAAARAAGGGSAKPAPGSTADILAAARGQGGGAASAAGAVKSGSPGKPAAAGVAKAAVSPAGERPSVAEMVKAAREGQPVAAVVASGPKFPSKPPMPQVKKSADASGRRGFLVAAITTLCTPYYLAWSALAAIGGIWGLATARFMMPNMIVEPPMKFKIGPPSDYPLGVVSEKWKAERGIWIVHTDTYDGQNIVYALASVCTHLGCTPNWLDSEQKYKCPCHGSGFYINGINFEGPAPRPLERVGLRLAEDGSLEVDKSVKFQEELGQWQDPASFVALS